MRLRLGALSAGLLALWTGGVLCQDNSFRTGTHMVAVYATALDRDGHLVPDLNRNDFELREDGRPVELSLFSNDPQPISVVLLLDMGSSVQPRLRLVREGARQFVSALTPADRAVIGTFNSEVWIRDGLTSNHAELDRVLDTELWPEGGSMLWTAVDRAMAVLSPATGRRVVLALSDGVDICPPRLLGDLCKTFREVRTQAVNQGFMVYGITVAGTLRDNLASRPEIDRREPTLTQFQYRIALPTDLRDLASDTGGGHFQANQADLGGTFTRVAEELRHQYVLGFVPSRFDGASHEIDVRVKKTGVTVRARKSYLAKANE